MSGTSKEGAPPKPLSTREQIPKADFIEDIDGYMAKEGSAEVVLEKLQRLYNSLKFIESKLVQEKAKMKVKVPELAKTVDSLVQMDAQAERGEELVTHYELAQSVYAKARVKLPEEDKVCLWLGANVMLEYSRAEAMDLTKANLGAAREKQKTIVDDMGYLRDQITTTEVNMARVFNWDVKERRKLKAQAAEEKS